MPSSWFAFALALAVILLVAALTRSPQVDPAMDYRAEVTRAQLDAFYADNESDPWQLVFWDNSKLSRLPNYEDEDSDDFEKLTHGQQMLMLAGIADAQILNGGVGQLFFNMAGSVPRMEQAFAEMLCDVASQTLDREMSRLAESNFIVEWNRAQLAFSTASEGGDKERAWQNFIDFNTKFFPGGDDDPDQRYYDNHDATIVCIKSHIRT